jgi:predicted TIM-barrel fold metal-dependent hydrolase
VTRLSRAEQLPYWINLYNALTVRTVLAHYPVTSIRKIRPGWLSLGPWKEKWVEVEEYPISLDDIEHRILRPIWRDPRIQCAVNCASLGCPNLQPTAFTRANTEALLENAAGAYVNHPRSVSFRGPELVVSSIYRWFREDFGDSDAGILLYLRQHAEPDLAARLGEVVEIADDLYDWRLNGAPQVFPDRALRYPAARYPEKFSMAYAQGRTYYDADSHIMELPDWALEFADPKYREQLPEIDLRAAGKMAEDFLNLRGQRAHDPATARRLEEDVIGGPKGWGALGSFNASERSRALDLLGFERQLVFPTFSFLTYALCEDMNLLYAGIRAANRAMAAFCEGDERLLGVACVSLADPERAAQEVEAALSMNLAAIWVPATAAGPRSPGHNDLDPIWARLTEARVPFVLHVGGSHLHIQTEFMNTGRPEPTDWLGGGENIRSKDMAVLHHDAERFLSTLIIDGVLERFPDLRGGAIELGAGWVPAMRRRLDHVVSLWSRSEPELREMKRLPSQQIDEQLAFTPYPFEDVDQLIRESSDGLYMFSSDYPHIEGGRDPIGRFGPMLAKHSGPTQDKFYADNFARMMRYEAR